MGVLTGEALEQASDSLKQASKDMEVGQALREQFKKEEAALSKRRKELQTAGLLPKPPKRQGNSPSPKDEESGINEKDDDIEEDDKDNAEDDNAIIPMPGTGIADNTLLGSFKAWWARWELGQVKESQDDLIRCAIACLEKAKTIPPSATEGETKVLLLEQVHRLADDLDHQPATLEEPEQDA